MKFWDDRLQTQYFFWIIWDGITLLLENHLQGSVKIITIRYKRFSLVWQVISGSYYTTGINKPCTHLHPAPSSLFQPPPSSFQSPPTSLQHPQQYLNQNIARNWAISPNLSWKIKSCLFSLKIGTRGILEVLIPNPDLGFWNSDPKIHFWANFSSKI